jgi:hypothetical protein
MFSADSVHNAFMDSTRKERMAFEKAAAGAADYKTADECLRGKGLQDCSCGRCKREWGQPGVDAQFYPVDSPFSRSAQDFPSYNRTLNACPVARQDMDGVDERCALARYPLARLLSLSLSLSLFSLPQLCSQAHIDATAPAGCSRRVVTEH